MLLKLDLSQFPKNNGNKSLKVSGAILSFHLLTEVLCGGKVDLLGKFCSNAWDKGDASWTNVPQCVFQKWSNTVGEFGCTLTSSLPSHMMEMDDNFEQELFIYSTRSV